MIGRRKLYSASLICVISAAFSVCFQATLTSQTLKVKAYLDSTKMLIGDQVTMHLVVDQPANARVTFPSYRDTIVGKLEVVKTLKKDTSNLGNGLRIHQAFVLTCFDSGSYRINSQAFPYHLGNKTDTIRTLALDLKVNTLPVDTTKEIRDIAAPVRIRFSLIDIWLEIAIVMGGLLILFLIWYAIKFRKKGNFFFPVKPHIPSHIVALQELDNLRNDKLWQNNKVKLYYTRLTEIIRNYIQNRYGINALEMTSDEILVALKKLRMEDDQPIELLNHMFLTADMVKFAKAEPLPDENEIGLLNAYQFVNNTKPVESITTEDNIQTQIKN